MLNLELTPIFRALADPNRRWMVEALLDGDTRVTLLADALPMSLTAVMQHLKVLERCGVASSYKIGPVRFYHAEPQALCTAERWLRQALWATHRDHLGSLPEDLGSRFP